MAIPKIIYQTFKTNKIPWLTRLYIKIFLWKNNGYRYEFYTDNRIDSLVKENFDSRTYDAYSRLQIGAAKADFFRYAVLYIYGGVYLDLDSDILVNLNHHLKDDDVAVITQEKNPPNFYAQWALIYDKGHPFLKRTIEYIVDNIENNTYLHDVHSMTGPTVYTKAIKAVLEENPSISYRIIPNDYKGIFQFKYKLAKILIYGDRSKHWKKLQQKITVVK